MPSQVTCECGYVARADTDDEVLTLVHEHVASDHPELVETVTDEVVRGWVTQVP